MNKVHICTAFVENVWGIRFVCCLMFSENGLLACLSASQSQVMWLFACSLSFCKHVASIEHKTSDLLVYMPLNLSLCALARHVCVWACTFVAVLHIHMYAHICSLQKAWCWRTRFYTVAAYGIVASVIVWPCFAQRLIYCTDAVYDQTYSLYSRWPFKCLYCKDVCP